MSYGPSHERFGVSYLDPVTKRELVEFPHHPPIHKTFYEIREEALMEEKEAVKGSGMDRPRVVLESPLSNRNGHTVEENVAYLNLCLKDSIARGEAPYASHRFYPGLLDDDNAEERKLGMEMGFNWGSAAAEAVVYVDHGITGGMLEGIRLWATQGKKVTYRALEEKNSPLADLLNHGA